MTSTNTTAQVVEPRCRGQPTAVYEPGFIIPSTEEGPMIRTITTAIAASALLLLGGGIASADVTSQSSSEVDHMASDTESSGPGSILRIVGYHPVYDQDGNQIFRADGTPVLLPTLMEGPISSGVADAEVVHGP